MCRRDNSLLRVGKRPADGIRKSGRVADNAYHRESDRPSYEEVTALMMRDYFVVRYDALEELNTAI